MSPKKTSVKNLKKSKINKPEALKTNKPKCKIMKAPSKACAIKKTGGRRGPRYVWLPENPGLQDIIFASSTHQIVWNSSVSGTKKTSDARYIWLPEDQSLHSDIISSTVSEVKKNSITEASSSSVSGIVKTGSTKAPNKNSKNARASKSKNISGIMSCHGSIFAPSRSETMNTKAANSNVSNTKKTVGTKTPSRKSKNAKPEASKSKKISGIMSCHGSMFVPKRSETMNIKAANSNVSNTKKTVGTKTPSRKSKIAKPEASKSKKISGIMSCHGSRFAPKRSETMNTKAANSNVSENKKTSDAKTPSKKSKNFKPETSEPKKIGGARKGVRRTARMKI